MSSSNHVTTFHADADTIWGEKSYGKRRVLIWGIFLPSTPP
ncbi:MAG: hypothetical protein ETSY1_00335 [Candidatus Entotheonella factor]|uniref:Uncharacterized protein n=1 Tax=Entotheonella factor TaxID=1429438 RepID=W4M047_ENTF1|nr:MAG: hypothetical protein ETSY1_00335 [Candidatus Entotheonella factor]